MMETIKVVIKKPHEKPREERIPRSFAEIEKILGGKHKVVRLCSDLVMMVREDEENLRDNCVIAGRVFRGNIIICGTEEVVDLREDELKTIPVTVDRLVRLLSI